MLFISSRIESNIWLGKDSLNILYNFHENWQSNPIIDIVSTNKTECPVGYEPLINDNFKGLKKGCYCKETDEIFPKSCVEYEGFEDICEDVKEVGKEVYKIYRKKVLCGKRLKLNYFNYLNEGKVEKKTCGKGYKNCGIIDSKSNILCLGENETCPINMIYFIDSENDNFIDNYHFNFTIVELDDVKRIAFTNQNIKGKVIIVFKIEDNYPCANPLYTNSKSSFTKYILHPYFSLDQCIPLKKDLIFDTRYEELDTYSFERVLGENLIKDKLLKVPGFDEKYISYSAILFSRNYINLDKKCLKQISNSINDYDDDFKFDENFLDHIGKELSNFKSKFYYNYMLIVIVIFIEIVYYMVVIKILEESEDFPKNWLPKIVTEVLECILLFLSGVISVISIKKVYSIKKIFNVEECSDIYTNIQLSSFYSNLNYYNIENFFLIVCAIISIAALIYSIIKFSKNIETDDSKVDNNLKKVFDLNKFE